MQTEEKLVTGKISLTTKAVGYVKNPDPDQKDIEISPDKLKQALPGDEVRVKIVALPKDKEEKPKGEVVDIVSRARDQFVGTIEKEGDSCLVKADNRKVYVDFVLNKEDSEKVNQDEKVLVKISDWPQDKTNPDGKLLKIFGHKGEHEVEIQSIIYEKGFVSEFPAKVEKEAEELKKIWETIPDSEIAKRKDLRDKLIMTIDPIDAKDFDDALSIETLPNGNFEIGIHIADVSHYVTPGSALDEEAFDRSFSVYMVDRTVPMLPEILSNDLCSLNPNEEKLAFSTIFEVTKDAEVKSRWFGKTIIKSKKRFTYEEAQAVLDAESGPHYQELDQLNEISKILGKKKYEAGAINFEKEEIKFELDKDGRPIRIIKKERMDTHKLVEEFMLLSNKEVAKYIFDFSEKHNSGNGLMYRVHDFPNIDRVNNLTVFLKALGYHLPVTEDGIVSAKDMNLLLAKVDGKPEESLIKTAAIRTMSKAIYSTQNKGHFGLAFEHYTHFTSPIRRYPDLLVHRILFKFINGEKLNQTEIAHFEESAKISTDREIAAAEAERESIKYKQAEFMMDHIGEEFEGVISGVSAWGIYVVENNTLSEGMIHISKLGNDYFSLDEKNYAVIGERTGKRFSLGDPIKFKIEKIDLEQKKIDMVLAK